MAETVHLDAGHEEGTGRRDFLNYLGVSLGGVGAGAFLWPVIDSMNPSKDVLAVASIEVDLSQIEVGSAVKVVWRGKPVFIRHRTDEEIAEARAVDVDQRGRHLHPSGLHPDRHGGRRDPGRIRRLVLSVPRVALRYVRAHTQGSGAAEPARADI